jgi:hypothetical protein
VQRPAIIIAVILKKRHILNMDLCRPLLFCILWVSEFAHIMIPNGTFCFHDFFAIIVLFTLNFNFPIPGDQPQSALQSLLSNISTEGYSNSVLDSEAGQACLTNKGPKLLMTCASDIEPGWHSELCFSGDGIQPIYSVTEIGHTFVEGSNLNQAIEVNLDDVFINSIPLGPLLKKISVRYSRPTSILEMMMS